MSPDEFHLATSRSKMGALAIRGAWLVLVEGRTCAEAAEECRRTEQWAGQAARRVRKAHAKAVPKGWERVEVWLPPEAAEGVRQQARDLRVAAETGCLHAGRK